MNAFITSIPILYSRVLGGRRTLPRRRGGHVKKGPEAAQFARGGD